MLTILTASWILNILIEKCFGAGPSYLNAELPTLTRNRYGQPSVVNTKDGLDDGHVSDVWGYYQGGVPPPLWRYLPNSPDCGGSNQSPVNFQIKNVIKTSSFPDFDFKELEQPIAMNMTNDGRRVDVTPLCGKPLISGGGLPGKFQLQSFHFHWGNQNGKGSEHRVDNKPCSMELHLELYKIDSSGEKMEVDKKKIVVIAVLIDVGKYNPKYSKLVNRLRKIPDVGNSTVLPSFPIMDLLPDCTYCYFRYFGSLTTPPCTESVIWTVFTDTVYISKSQMKKFHNLVGKGHIFTNPKHLIEDTYRPIQKLNKRKVIMHCSKNKFSPLNKQKYTSIGALNQNIWWRGKYIY